MRLVKVTPETVVVPSSAAAELAVPERAALKQTIAGSQQSLIKSMLAKIRAFRYSLEVSSSRLIRRGHPTKRLAELRLHLDELTARAHGAASRQLKRERHRLASASYRLSRYGLKARIEQLNIILKQHYQTLCHKIEYLLNDRRNRLGIQVTRLNGLNPLKILERGYSVTRRLPDGTVLTDTRLVEVGNQVGVTLHKGEMTCTVIRKKNAYAQADV
jgi:exodeoxyribonuclease VII large subunit